VNQRRPKVVPGGHPAGTDVWIFDNLTTLKAVPYFPRNPKWVCFYGIAMVDPNGNRHCGMCSANTTLTLNGFAFYL
jgi:hypothetical protein